MLLAPLLSSGFGFGSLEWGLTLVASALSAMLFVFAYYLYGRQQVVFYNFLLFLRGYAWLYVLIPFVLLSGLQLTITGIVISWIGLIAIALTLAIHQIGFSHLIQAPIDLSWFRFSVKYGTPLLPFFLSVWGMLAISKYILVYVSDSAQVALFSISYTMFDMIYLIAVSISQTLSPYIFADWKDERRSSIHFDAAMKYSVLLAVWLSLEVLLLGRQVIQLLAGEAYIDAAVFIPLIAPLPLLRVLSANMQQRLMATDRTRQMGIIYITGLLCVLVTGLWWAQLWGTFGVIASLLFTQTILLVMITWKVQGEIKLHSEYFPFYRMLASSIVLVFFTWLGMTVLSSWKLLPFALAAVMPVVYLAVLYACGAVSRREIAFARSSLSRIGMQIVGKFKLNRG